MIQTGEDGCLAPAIRYRVRDMKVGVLPAVKRSY